MIPWVSNQIGRFNRWFDRAYWSLRVLPFKQHENAYDSPGLVLIQIDGLSEPQFERALAEGRLPFIKRLMRRERYVRHAHYSGLPSSTPAVQGELFYGVKNCVPAFHFKDRDTGRVFVMYDPKCASEIERRLAASGNSPLLESGSSYSNIFCGGAAESHFCAAGLGWKSWLKTMNPVSWPILIFFHFDIFVRVFVLVVVEFFISLAEGIRGAFQGKGWAVELSFILMRMVACVYLREVTVIGARIDIARGLPVIHANFFGYDEQSHRRGPTSEFAHWTLRGIDSAVARIYRQAASARRRDYDVWIYSDHGQEKTIPYQVTHRRRIDEAVAEIFGEIPTDVSAASKQASKTAARSTSGWGSNSCCGGSGPRHTRKRTEPMTDFVGAAGPADTGEIPVSDEKPRVLVTGMGPLAHIYPPAGFEWTDETLERVVRELLEKAKAPMVLVPVLADPDRRVRVRTAEGEFMLPEDAPRIFADNHPFLNEVTQDLMTLCHHPNAGQIILSAWTRGRAATTFPLENGSHAGFGPNETNGFALLPMDAPLRRRTGYLRPFDIRAAALRFLGRSVEQAVEIVGSPEGGLELHPVELPSGNRSEPAAPPVTVRVMTYNVHGCVGMDGKLSPDRIARIIARHNPDIIALQELDVCRRRSGEKDQAKVIADKLNMQFHFHASRCAGDEKYGNAILSRYPLKLVRAGALPATKGMIQEPRGAIWAEIDVRGHQLQFVNTHLSIWSREGFVQARAIRSKEWLEDPECLGAGSKPVVLCGDFNAMPHSAVFKVLCRSMRDAQLELAGRRPHKTLPGFYPIGRIDHVFLGPGVKTLDVQVPRMHLERIASDHLPLVVDLQIFPLA